MNDRGLYRDLDLTLTSHPLTNDIAVLTNETAIKRSIKNLFLIERYDVPFNSSPFSMALKSQLFEMVSPVTQSAIHSLSKWLIETYEPRVEVKEIEVTPTQREDGYEITIYYKIISMGINDNAKVLLRRIR